MLGKASSWFGAAVLASTLVACSGAAPDADGGSGGTNAGGTSSGGQTAAGGTSSGGQTASGGTGGYAGGVYPENCLALCQAKEDGGCLGVELQGCLDSCGQPTFFGDANQCPVMMESYYACLMMFDPCTTPPECDDEHSTIINQCLGTP